MGDVKKQNAFLAKDLIHMGIAGERLVELTNLIYEDRRGSNRGEKWK